MRRRKVPAAAASAARAELCADAPQCWVERGCITSSRSSTQLCLWSEAGHLLDPGCRVPTAGPTSSSLMPTPGCPLQGLP